MNKQQALEILRLWQQDKNLLLECQRRLQEDKAEKILELLRQRNLEAKAEDLMLALDAQWIFGKMVETQGGGRKARPTFDLRLSLQEGLARVVEQIDAGYRRAMTMYTVAFYLGVALVLVSIFAALVLDSERAAAVLGGLGMADILAAMIFRPAQEVQNSRGNLAQLQAAFFSWFNDVFNWNQYLQLIDREASGRNVPPEFERLRKVSEAQMRTVARMMALIEEYCETRGGRGAERKVKPRPREEAADGPPTPPAEPGVLVAMSHRR